MVTGYHCGSQNCTRHTSGTNHREHGTYRTEYILVLFVQLSNLPTYSSVPSFSSPLSINIICLFWPYPQFFYLIWFKGIKSSKVSIFRARPFVKKYITLQELHFYKISTYTSSPLTTPYVNLCLCYICFHMYLQAELPTYATAEYWRSICNNCTQNSEHWWQYSCGATES